MNHPPHYKRHRDDEFVDSIEFKIVPRYKMSGLSGDEWRISVVVELKRKGMLLHKRGYHRFDDAAAHLPWLLRTFTEMPDDETEKQIQEAAKRSKDMCFQPGCCDVATVEYELKHEYTDMGDKTDPPPWGYRRKFCDRHSTRGDCGLEDADSNYVVVSGDRKDVPADDESPSMVM